MPDEQILSTKLHGPEPHPSAVDRTAALDWLDARLADDGSVVLSALPGSGRLDLLARWASNRSSVPTVWLRLDAWDDLARFTRHLIAAIQGIDERIGAEVADAVDEGMATIRDTVLPTLVADCARHEEPFNLVVNGVDRVEDVATVGALRATQRYRPDNVRVLWLSDDDGPADFQTADGVTHVPHIDARLLAFTVGEIEEMYRRADVPVSPAQAAGLRDATDGWAMAVLHLVEAGRTAGRFVPYDPSDRTLAARIDRAVVNPLPEDLQAVASDLAVVGSATPHQFEQLTDRRGAAADFGELGRRHVVSELDGSEGRWAVVAPIRAHLSAQREVHDAPTAVVLRRRMARAFADADDARSALDLLADAGDHEARARLLLERHRQWSGRDEPAVLEHAEAALMQDPSLAELHLVRAWHAAFNDRDLERASTVIDAVERIPLRGTRAMRAHSEIEFLRAMLARRAGHLTDCAEFARAGSEIGTLIDRSAEEDLAEWPYLAVVPATVSLYLGHCLFHAGEIKGARDELLRANNERNWSSAALAAIHGVLALIGWIEDDPSARIHSAIAASHLGDELNANNHLAAAALALASSGTDAEEMAARYVREAPAIGEPAADVFGHLVAARHGDRPSARRALAAARRAVEACPQPGVLSVALARAAAQTDDPEVARELGEELTEGERRVVLALRGDLTEREIAAELNLSHNTVRTYRRRAYRKLGVTSRSEATEKLEESGADPG